MVTVFDQQCEIVADKIVVKAKTGGACVQNPSDMDATYDRHKVQLAETCSDENEVQLIVSAIPQTAADAFRERYAKRSGIESTNGGLKRKHRLRKLRVRGSPAVRHAIFLKVAGWNMNRATASGKLTSKVAGVFFVILRTNSVYRPCRPLPPANAAKGHPQQKSTQSQSRTFVGGVKVAVLFELPVAISADDGYSIPNPFFRAPSRQSTYHANHSFESSAAGVYAD